MAHSEVASGWRIGKRAVVLRPNAPDLKRANELVTEFAPWMGSHPDYQSGINEIVSVFDLVRKELSVVVVRRAGHRATSERTNTRLLKFSEREFAPCRAEELQLVTPDGYRMYEGAGPGVADPKDGCLTKDATPWMTNAVSTGGSLAPGIALSLKAEITFVSSDEPWIYCTSMMPATRSAIQELRAEFPQN